MTASRAHEGLVLDLELLERCSQTVNIWPVAARIRWPPDHMLHNTSDIFLGAVPLLPVDKRLVLASVLVLGGLLGK